MPPAVTTAWKVSAMLRDWSVQAIGLETVPREGIGSPACAPAQACILPPFQQPTTVAPSRIWIFTVARAGLPAAVVLTVQRHGAPTAGVLLVTESVAFTGVAAAAGAASRAAASAARARRRTAPMLRDGSEIRGLARLGASRLLERAAGARQ